MQFTIEFSRVWTGDGAHAPLDRILQDVPDRDGAEIRAKSLSKTLDMPQAADGLRILDSHGDEVFAWSPAHG